MYYKKTTFPAVPAYLNLEEIEAEIDNNNLVFPIIVKPRTGSASLGVTKVNSYDELAALFKKTKDLIAQPFMEGDEYGVDCYVDLQSKQPTDIFCKRKIRMRAGETDKSIAIKDPDLFTLIEKLLDTLKPSGPIDIDCFKTANGYVISEINPRFGGGYLHAHESGHNFVRNIINNLQGIANESQIGNYQDGTIMIKFDGVIMINS